MRHSQVTDQLLVHRTVGEPDRPAIFMFSADRGVALFEIVANSPSKRLSAPLKSAGEFIPNAAIVDAEGVPLSWFSDVPREGTMSSYFSQIEHEHQAVRLVCLRGEIFGLDLASLTLNRLGHYPKY